MINANKYTQLQANNNIKNILKQIRATYIIYYLFRL